MINQKFKYYLRKKISTTWNYYYINASGNVALIPNTKTPLVFAPEGWQDQVINWERGFEYFGLITNYANPLKFTNDGAKILRYLYYTYGIEADVQILIDKFNDSVSIWDYEQYYIGDIDMSRFRDERYYVQVDIMDSGFLANFKAKENTNFEMDLEQSPQRVWVNMDGHNLLGAFEFTGVNQPSDDNGDVFQKLNVYSGQERRAPLLNHYLTEGYSNGDLNPTGMPFFFQQAGVNNLLYRGNGTTTFFSAKEWEMCFIKNEGTGTYTVNINGRARISSFNDPSSGASIAPAVVIWKVKNGAVITPVPVIIGEGSPVGTGVTLDDTFQLSGSMTIQPGEGILLTIGRKTVSGSVLVEPTFHVHDVFVRAEFLNKIRQSYIPALRSNKVFDDIIALIDNSITPTSLPIDGGIQLDTVLTSGDGLRSLEDSKIKTNISDFFRSANALWNLALHYDKANEYLNLLNKSDAFNNGLQIIDLGEVSKLDVMPFGEIFSNLKIGYPNTTYDEVNGKDEFNIEQEFQMPIKRSQKKVDLRSVYRADMYGIEITRGNLENKKFADSESDNDLFWLRIENTPAGTITDINHPGYGENYYNLYRDGSMTINGLTSPDTAFNIELSPKRNLFRYGNWLHSMAHLLDAEYIKWQVGSKNQDANNSLQTTLGPVTITEREDVLVGDLDNIIFKPIIFDIECKHPDSVQPIMDATPFGKIRFTYKGYEYYGFVIQVSDEPFLRPKQKYKLLCSPNTDINNLIR